MTAFDIQTFLESGYLQGFFENFRTIVPGKIVSVSGNTATVSVAIQALDSAQEPIEGTVTLYSVPCMMIGGSSNYMTTQLAAGDNGLLLVCDRDIDNYKSSDGSNGACATPGIANLKDSIFISGLFLPSSTGTKIYSSTQVTVQVGESTSLTITPSQIQMSVGGSTLTLTSSALVSSVPIEAPSYSGPDDAAALMTSGIDMDGQDIVNAGDVKTSTNVSLKDHVHTSADAGEDTSAPIPS